MSYFENLLKQHISTEGLFGFGATDIGEIEMKPTLKQYEQGKQITLTHVKAKGFPYYSENHLPLINGKEPVSLIAGDIPHIVKAVKTTTLLVNALNNDDKLSTIPRGDTEAIRQYLMSKYKRPATELANELKQIQSIKGFRGENGRKISFTLPNESLMQRNIETIQEGVYPILTEIGRLTDRYGDEVTYRDFTLGIPKLRRLIEGTEYAFEEDADGYYEARDEVYRGTPFDEINEYFFHFIYLLFTFSGNNARVLNRYLKNLGLNSLSL